MLAGILALVDVPAYRYIRDVGAMLVRPIHYFNINQIKSNLLPYYYIRTGFRVYTLVVVHYYNTLIYLYSADIL